MKFAVKSLKISTGPEPLRWADAFCENGLFIVIATEGNSDEPAAQKGKEILDLILTKITNFQKRDLETLSEFINWAKELKAISSLTIGFLEENVLYLANIGGGDVLLVRNSEVGTIISDNDIASGKLILSDQLLFTSKSFKDLIEKEKQKEILKSDNLTGIVEQMYEELVSKPASFGAGALLIQIEEKIDAISFLNAPNNYSVSFQEKIRQKWQILLSSLKQKREDFWQDDDEAKSKKTLITIAMILILLLVASIFLNISNSQLTNKQNRLKQTLDLVSHQYEEAVSLIDLNPSRSRVLLSDSKLSLSSLTADFPKNSAEYKQLTEWLNKVTEKEVAAYRIYKFTEVPLFFDINLIKPQGIASKIAIYKKTAVILDSQNKTVYSLSLDTKQASIIAGSEIVKDAESAAIHGKSAYLINNEGIQKIDMPSKSSQLIIKADKEWGDISQIVAFAGNLYLLDRKNNAIWKYIAAENGFLSRTSYLNPDVRVALGGAQKMIIDGSVWVLSDPATIIKFVSGHAEPFSFKGLADTISDTASIFTSDEAKRLYVLDKNLKRILVFDKEGDYKEQYQWDGLSNAIDLVVSEEDKKIFVLSGSKIYAIDLK